MPKKKNRSNTQRAARELAAANGWSYAKALDAIRSGRDTTVAPQWTHVVWYEPGETTDLVAFTEAVAAASLLAEKPPTWHYSDEAFCVDAANLERVLNLPNELELAGVAFVERCQAVTVDGHPLSELEMDYTGPLEIAQAARARLISARVGPDSYIYGSHVIADYSDDAVDDADHPTCPNCGSDDWDFLVNNNALCGDCGHRWDIDEDELEDDLFADDTDVHIDDIDPIVCAECGGAIIDDPDGSPGVWVHDRDAEPPAGWETMSAWDLDEDHTAISDI